MQIWHSRWLLRNQTLYQCNFILTYLHVVEAHFQTNITFTSGLHSGFHGAEKLVYVWERMDHMTVMWPRVAQDTADVLEHGEAEFIRVEEFFVLSK